MEDEVLISEHGEDKRLVQEFMAHGGTPSFVARANRVQSTWEAVVQHCRQQRAEWLTMVRIRLGALVALAGDWTRLEAFLGSEQVRALQWMYAELRPNLRVTLTPTGSEAVLRKAIHALAGAIRRFNARWLAFLRSVDLGAVNEARDKYNRYYLLEKECVVGSMRLAQRGFTPQPMATVRELEEALPPLAEID